MAIEKMQSFKDTHIAVISTKEFARNLISELNSHKYKLAERSEWANEPPAAVYAHIVSTLRVTTTPKCFTYWRPSSAVAKVSGDAILFNRRHLGRLGDVDGGSTILHERGHIQMGFQHDFWATKRRENSLCYLLNRVFEQTAQELGYRESKPKPVTRTPWWAFWRRS